MAESIYEIPLYLSSEERAIYRIRHAPTIHIAHGYQAYLPFLNNNNNNIPLICISDWQYETATQEMLWKKAKAILQAELGGRERLERAIVLVAGDMASNDNTVLGVRSDDVPRLDWLRKSVGNAYMIYGNHDLMANDHLNMTNKDGSLCYLPHGRAIPVSFRNEIDNTSNEEKKNDAIETVATTDKDNVASSPDDAKSKDCSDEIARNDDNIIEQPKVHVKPGMRKAERTALHVNVSFKKIPKKSKQKRRNEQYRQQNPEQAMLANQMKWIHKRIPTVSTDEDSSVRIGAVHGIPSNQTIGYQKLEREKYFQAVRQACDEPTDIFMTHSNPCLPGQESKVLGEDPKKLYEAFLTSSAKLYVHGHMHTEPAVSVVAGDKVVVNADCRIIVFVPG